MDKANQIISSAGRLKGSQINWNQVYYFSEIAVSGSIKEAAKKLDLAPPTLSQHLAQLETDLALKLFYRQHRKLTLTPEGHRLFVQAKAMFETGQRLIDVVSPVPLGHYPLSIGLVPTPSIQLATEVLAKVLAQHGPLNMKIFRSDYAELEKDLAQAKFDFAFSDRIPERKNLVYQAISKVSIGFYVSPQWKGMPFAQLLEKLPLLICHAGPTQRSLAEQVLIDADLIPSAVISSDYPSTLMDLCQQGLGIGVFSESSRPDSSMLRLTNLQMPQDAPKLHDNLYVIWCEEAERSAAVRLLQETLKKEGLGQVFQ